MIDSFLVLFFSLVQELRSSVIQINLFSETCFEGDVCIISSILVGTVLFSEDICDFFSFLSEIIKYVKDIFV